MIRKIIKIDRALCNGCGLCADACHEGAIAMVDGRAALVRENYCDGLGNCLPVCPTGAISFEEREAPAFDEAAAGKPPAAAHTASCSGGCPGTQARSISREMPSEAAVPTSASVSRLMQWPVQLQLVPVQAPYFENANLLIAADCAAYANGDFHNLFMKNRITMIGCPKLDGAEYAEKLTEIFRRNNIKSITVVRMEVPCCGGIEYSVRTALQNCGKLIPWQVVILSTTGEIID